MGRKDTGGIYKSVQTIQNIQKYSDTMDTVQYEQDGSITPPVMDTAHTPSSPDSPLWIGNALAVIICIADDEDESLEIKQDYSNLCSFFEYLNFTMFRTRYARGNPFVWTEKDLTQLLLKDIGRALFDDDSASRGIAYDGLVVCISAHGSDGCLVTSDNKAIELEVIHQAVSQYHPSIRDIPRIFVMNIYESSDELSPVIERLNTATSPIYGRVRSGSWQYLKSDNEDAVMSTLVQHDLAPVPGSVSRDRGDTLKNAMDYNQLSWKRSAKESTHNLAVITSNGTFIFYSFIERIIGNIEEDDDKRLVDICRDIQHDLRVNGRSPAMVTLNGETKFVMMRVNDIGLEEEESQTVGISSDRLDVPDAFYHKKSFDVFD